MKILFTATVQSHICQFHKLLIQQLRDEGHEVDVAARYNLDEKDTLRLDFSDGVFDIPFERNPVKGNNLIAYKRLKEIISSGNYDVVVCNTPVAGVITRLCANKYRKKGLRVIYVAHGFHFYKGAPLRNWICAYPVEKLLADFFTDKIITINNEDYEFSKRHFRTDVGHIYGVGVDGARFHPIGAEARAALRNKGNISEDDFVLLCIGELVPNKNQKTIIAAVSRISQRIPHVKLLIAGNGHEKTSLRRQIETLGLEDKVVLLGYRSDIEDFVGAADVVVSCSHREGLGLNIIEAMLCKTNVVVSDNRGHRELIESRASGYIVDCDDAEAYADAILSIYEDKENAVKMAENAYLRAQKYCYSGKTIEALGV